MFTKKSKYGLPVRNKYPYFVHENKRYTVLPMKNFVLLFFFVLAGFALKAQTSARPELAVFPNPATEYFSVNDNNDQVGHVLVFNIVGKQVKSFDFVKGERYSVLDLPKGYYLVQLLDRNQKVLTTQKLDKR